VRLLAACLLAIGALTAAQERPTTAGVLGAADASDWRTPAPEHTLYLEFATGTVVFELAPAFAPAHIANLRKLVAGRYFDGLAIIRAQDNYVVQWGDPNANTDTAKSPGDAATSLEPEFFRDADGLPFTRLDSRDTYAAEVGFSAGFPVGRDATRAWLIHCYGMLGVGRANPPDSGSGAELYVVTGHAPRHLDRNVTLLGRALSGIENLASLPRGSAALGFYENAGEHIPILSIRFGDELPQDERLAIEVLRTDTATFSKLVEARRYRAEDWFVDPAEAIEICNVPLPTRLHRDD
jgi:peptidylprolyl isomerase